MKLLSFGEIIWDVFPSGAHLGGAPLNFAAHAAMQGVDAYILSAVADDELGKRALFEITELGVKTDYVSISPKPTGSCIVTLDERGVPSYNLVRDTAYDDIALPDVTDGDAFDVLAFGTLALRDAHNMETLKDLLGKVSFPVVFSDLNIRAPFYSKESILFCLENANILKISDEELPIITRQVFGKEFDTLEEAAKAIFHSFGKKEIVIITKGAEGAYAYRNGEEYYCDAAEAEVVSTVGAGDSFGSSFLSQYLSGKTPDEALAIASRISAFVVSNTGAVPKYDVKDFI